MVINYQLLDAEVVQHPYPLLFATISGAHLYGFPSPDSDYDLRGVHLLPIRDVVGILPKRETVEVSGIRQGTEIDLVTHDAAKFFSLMLKRNGYVLEQLYSPLVVSSQPEHRELMAIGAKCITRFHSHHYLGFAATQWSLFAKETPPRIKPLLYLYRVLLTGIHLMRTGRVEANLNHLNEEFRLPYIPELIARKMAGAEQSALHSPVLEFHEAEYRRLVSELEQASERSSIQTESGARDELNDLLVRLRLQGLKPN
jgi:predicted nucleotidyltransferase